MTKKQLYETPEAEVLVVKIERNILSDGTWDNSIRKGSTWADGDPEDGYGLE